MCVCVCVSHTRTYKHKPWVQQSCCVWLCVCTLSVLTRPDPCLSLPSSVSTHMFLYIYHHVCSFMLSAGLDLGRYQIAEGSCLSLTYLPLPSSTHLVAQTASCAHRSDAHMCTQLTLASFQWPDQSGLTHQQWNQKPATSRGTQGFNWGRRSLLAQNNCWRGCLRSFLILSWETSTVHLVMDEWRWCISCKFFTKETSSSYFCPFLCQHLGCSWQDI